MFTSMILKAWFHDVTPPSYILVKRKLNGGVGEALIDKQWKNLVEYVDMFNKQYPNNRVLLVRTLAVHSGEDVVAKAIITARQSDSTEHIATTLLKQHFECWLNNRKSGDDVFELFVNLQQVGAQSRHADVLASPARE
ncbi:hypothetical protein ON010_g6996 [Phytophthora cinnamomi]|nr:hypothetical protein ON010_g6996 [Phytophthora cinnamomi]